MKPYLILLAIVMTGCGGSNGSSNSASGKKGDDKNKKAAAQVQVPDSHASSNPNVGREAGVGDDPSNLQAADPHTGESGSGGRQAHATR